METLNTILTGAAPDVKSANITFQSGAVYTVLLDNGNITGASSGVEFNSSVRARFSLDYDRLKSLTPDDFDNDPLIAEWKRNYVISVITDIISQGEDIERHDYFTLEPQENANTVKCEPIPFNEALDEATDEAGKCVDAFARIGLSDEPLDTVFFHLNDDTDRNAFNDESDVNRLILLASQANANMWFAILKSGGFKTSEIYAGIADAIDDGDITLVDREGNPIEHVQSQSTEPVAEAPQYDVPAERHDDNVSTVDRLTASTSEQASYSVPSDSQNDTVNRLSADNDETIEQPVVPAQPLQQADTDDTDVSIDYNNEHQNEPEPAEEPIQYDATDVTESADNADADEPVQDTNETTESDYADDESADKDVDTEESPTDETNNDSQSRYSFPSLEVPELHTSEFNSVNTTAAESAVDYETVEPAETAQDDAEQVENDYAEQVESNDYIDETADEQEPETEQYADYTDGQYDTVYSADSNDDNSDNTVNDVKEPVEDETTEITSLPLDAPVQESEPAEPVQPLIPEHSVDENVQEPQEQEETPEYSDANIESNDLPKHDDVDGDGIANAADDEPYEVNDAEYDAADDIGMDDLHALFTTGLDAVDNELAGIAPRKKDLNVTISEQDERINGIRSVERQVGDLKAQTSRLEGMLDGMKADADRHVAEVDAARDELDRLEAREAELGKRSEWLHKAQEVLKQAGLL